MITACVNLINFITTLSLSFQLYIHSQEQVWSLQAQEKVETEQERQSGEWRCPRGGEEEKKEKEECEINQQLHHS